MSTQTPSTHSLSVRVYYEDTDAGGIVYYVNYLKFMERARTEFLRSLGKGHRALREEGQMLVVADSSVQFKRPALLDDELTVTAEIESTGRAKIVFQQQVLRGEELLCQGRFVIGCVDANTMKPVAITEALRNKCVAVTKLTQD